jgi:gluconokinase
VIAVVMGVSGAGKTAIGEALAHELGWRFIDADEYHPEANVAKMAAGVPLEDDDRWPWLDRLNTVMKEEKKAVVACSALKERYRQRLAQGIEQIEWIWLKGDFELIHSRLSKRQHRYMPASLLESQFAALEPPAHAIAVDVSADLSVCVGEILAKLANKISRK